MDREMEDLIRAYRLQNADSPLASLREVPQFSVTSESALLSKGSPILIPSWLRAHRAPFQEYRPPYLVERCDYLPHYELFIFGDGNMYRSEDVNDLQWKESLDIAFRGEKPTIVFTSEDWFKLRINNPSGNIGDFSQLLSPDEAPTGKDEWYEFTENYVPPVPVPVFKGTRMILEDGRAGKLLFIRTFRSVPSRWADYLRASSERYGGVRCR